MKVNSSSKARYAEDVKRLNTKYRSTTHYMLSSLIPYTEANVKLVFSAHTFFNDLEKLSGNKRRASAIRSSYYRAVKQGLINVDESGTPRLTEAGEVKLKRYEPKKLKGAASVLVIFDIPEKERRLRHRLRVVLRSLYFTQVQQSVWQSEYDVIEYLLPELNQNKLTDYVQVHESARII